MNEENRKREYKGILSAAKILNQKHCFLITDNKEENIKVDRVNISIIPAWTRRTVKDLNIFNKREAAISAIYRNAEKNLKNEYFSIPKSSFRNFRSRAGGQSPTAC